MSWVAACGHYALRRAARVTQLLGDGMDARCDAIFFCLTFSGGQVLIQPAGSLSKLQFRHRSPHHLRQLDLEAISILPSKCCFLKELTSCCLSLLLSVEHQCELGT